MKKIIFGLLLSTTLLGSVAYADTEQDLTNKINDLKAQITAKTDEKNQTNADIDSKNKEIEQLQEQLNKIQKTTDIDNVSSQITDLKSKKSKTSSEIKDRKTMLKGTWSLGKLKEASNASEFFNEMSEIVAGKDSKLESLESKKNTLNNQVSNLSDVESEVKKSNDKINGERKSIQSDLNTKKSEVEQLTAKNSDIDKNLNELNTNVSNSENELKQEQAKKAEKNKKSTTTAKAQTNGINSVSATSFSDPADQELFNKVKDNVSAGDAGLSTHTRQIKNFLAAKFNVSSTGGVRGDDDGTGHGHGSGLAVDFMVDKTTGNALASYVAKNFNNLGVYYQIWQQRYYMNMNNIYGPANTWNLMDDRGSATANHMDHVHISFAY